MRIRKRARPADFGAPNVQGRETEAGTAMSHKIVSKPDSASDTRDTTLALKPGPDGPLHRPPEGGEVAASPARTPVPQPASSTRRPERRSGDPRKNARIPAGYPTERMNRT